MFEVAGAPFNHRLHQASAVVTPLVPSGAPTRRFAPAALAGEPGVSRVFPLDWSIR